MWKFGCLLHNHVRTADLDETDLDEMYHTDSLQPGKLNWIFPVNGLMTKMCF